MARETPSVTSVRRDVHWVGAHPTAALATGLLTIVVLTLTMLFTIGVILLFAGIAFSIHVAVVDELEATSTDEPLSQSVAVP